MGPKNIIALILFFTAIGLLLRTVSLLWNTTLPDFSIFYQAVFVGFSKQNVYTYQNFFAPFIYPPFFLLFMYPFSFFSFQLASQIWLVFSVLLYGASIFLLRRVLSTSFLSFSIVFFFSVLSFPVKFTLGMGQINMLVLFFITVFCYSYKKKEWTASIFWILAVITKIIPLIFFYPILLEKNISFIVKSVCIVIIALGISVSVFGFGLNMFYLSHIFPSVILGGVKASYYNQSLPGTLVRFHLESLKLITQIIIGGSAIFAIWLKKPKFIESLSLLLTGALLASSFSWQHHLILLVIPLYVLFVSKKTFVWYLLVLIAYILISINIKDPTVFQNRWYGNIILSHATFGIILIFIMMHVMLLSKTYEKTQH